MTFRKRVFLTLALVSVVAAWSAQLQSAPRSRRPKPIHQDEIWVAGIDARTTAAKEMSPDSVIPELWQRFMQEGVFHKIPNKADETPMPSTPTSPTNAVANTPS